MRAKSVYVLSLLANVGDMQVVSVIIDRIDDDDASVRKEVINALRIVGRKNDEKSVLDIASYMDSWRDEVRTTAIHCLHSVVRPGFLTAIVEVCARFEAPSHSVKVNALAALPLIAHKGDQAAIVEVVNRLQHPLPPVRSIALQALHLVANKGHRFALAAVGNLMEHPDYEVRRAAAQGVQLLCYPGDLSAIQVVVMRLKIDTDADCVREGAKYVSAPTTGNPPGWRDPALPQFGPQKMRGDAIAFDRIFTPRLPRLMPIGREAAVAYHTPVLPAEKGVKTIAQMWWRDKYQSDVLRHRYQWAGPATAQALSISPPAMPRPGTSSLRNTTTGSINLGAGFSKLQHTKDLLGMRVKATHTAQLQGIGGNGDHIETDALPQGSVSRGATPDVRLRTAVMQERARTGVSATSTSCSTSHRGTGNIIKREQRLNQQMKDASRAVLDVIEKGSFHTLFVCLVYLRVKYCLCLAATMMLGCEHTGVYVHVYVCVCVCACVCACVRVRVRSIEVCVHVRFQVSLQQH